MQYLQDTSHATGAPLRLRGKLPTDLATALIFLLLFSVALHALQFHHALGESDLYRVLVGLLDGEVRGSGIFSSLHYDNIFGFGYLKAFYVLGDPTTLRDPDKITTLMNEVGFWFMLVALLCFWCAVSVVHGTLASTVALITFALCPTILELGTSGHPMIPMFAFLCAGATLLFLPLSGRNAVLAASFGGLCLLAGLMTRGDIVLAFPWLVLTRADTRSVWPFALSCMVRSIPPVAAIVGFLVIQRLFVPHQLVQVANSYFNDWFDVSNLGRGMGFMILGGGIATTAAGGLALLWLACIAQPRIKRREQTGLAQILGPIALILVPMALFVPNPDPPRHFMLTYAGISIVVAMGLTVGLKVRREFALGIALLLGFANQGLGEAVRQPLVAANDRRSPYRPIWTGYSIATHVPLGWVWERHQALAKRRLLWEAEGDKIATPCQSHTIVVTDETAQFFSRFYARGMPVEAHKRGFDDIEGRLGVQRNKVVLVLRKATVWPKDLVALILSDPSYADYKIYEDPYTLTKYDITPIPPDRQALFGCPEPAP